LLNGAGFCPKLEKGAKKKAYHHFQGIITSAGFDRAGHEAKS
jgi:hypothetical protein